MRRAGLSRLNSPSFFRSARIGSAFSACATNAAVMARGVTSGDTKSLIALSGVFFAAGGFSGAGASTNSRSGSKANPNITSAETRVGAVCAASIDTAAPRDQPTSAGFGSDGFCVPTQRTTLTTSAAARFGVSQPVASRGVSPYPRRSNA
jgi:hypothetical protein